MTNVGSVQSNSTLAQLLALQQSTQKGSTLTTQAASTPSNATDTLSISADALKALQGLGIDPTQTQTQATYKPHGHHHRHGAAAQLPQESSTQSGTSNIQIQTSKTSNDTRQTAS